MHFVCRRVFTPPNKRLQLTRPDIAQFEARRRLAA